MKSPFIFALLLAVSCGPSGGLPGAAGGAGATARELDALERDLTTSEEELGDQITQKLGSLESSRSKTEAADDSKEDTDEAGGSAKPKKAAPAEEPAAEAAPLREEAPVSESPCERVCRALGSMRRSSERICLITGADDARCTRARERVKAAKDRVSKAGCSCSD